jgi:peptide deformylase
MTRLTILEYPDPRLRTRAVPVDAVDAGLRELIDDMLETMYAAKGIGLAATQVNVHRRLLVADVSDGRNEPRIFVNPEILSSEGTEISQEGCLSVPGYYDDVERAERIRVRALDRQGRIFEADLDGLLAICVQHEIDHLDGVLFIDHISALKRNMILRKLLKARKEKERDEAEGKPAKDKAKDTEHAL